MDESAIDSKLKALQQKIDAMNEQIEAAGPDVWDNQERMHLEKSLAHELGTAYREILKLLLQAGREDETFYPLHMSTHWFTRINDLAELAENSLILSRMQEMDGHYDWAESTMRVALWYARYIDKEKAARYKDAMRELRKRKKREQGVEQQDEEEMDEEEMDEEEVDE
jgi:hypothetical protein